MYRLILSIYKNYYKNASSIISLGLIVFISWTIPFQSNAQLYNNQNSVYQYSTECFFHDSLGNIKVANAYLWIPPSSKKIQGVIVLNQNVLEQWLAEHSAIRKACADNNLAILWCCRGFYVSKDNFMDSNVQCVYRTLRALASISGYEEIARVPWLPIGHSMTNNFVRQLVTAAPKHIIAAITLKGGPGYKNNHDIPILCTAGQFFEWNQRKEDLINLPDSFKSYRNTIKERAQLHSPISYCFDPGTGHFDCSEELTRFIASYINQISKLRLNPSNDTILLPIQQNKGWLASMSLPNEKLDVLKSAKNAVNEETSLPWYPNKTLARQAKAMTNIDWKRKTQVTAFANLDGSPASFSKRNIVWPIPYDTDSDGVTLKIPTTTLQSFPDSFVNTNIVLGNSHLPSKMVLLCGNATALDNHSFQILPGRSFNNNPTYFIIRQEGNKAYRTSIQPGQFVLEPNTKGIPQTIHFDAIPPMSRKNKTVKLYALSTSKLPVRFFVKYGPAIVKGNELTLSSIPRRSKLPIEISVVAYQWGRSKEPAVQTAERVEQTILVD